MKVLAKTVLSQSILEEYKMKLEQASKPLYELYLDLMQMNEPNLSALKNAVEQSLKILDEYLEF
jgi:hypothetical protein